LEYVFEGGEQNSPNAVTKEKVAEIAADFMTTFYHEQVGALETQEFRTTPAPFWLVCFSDTVKGPMREMYSSFCCPMGRWLCRGWRNGCRHHFGIEENRPIDPLGLTEWLDFPRNAIRPFHNVGTDWKRLWRCIRVGYGFRLRSRDPDIIRIQECLGHRNTNFLPEIESTVCGAFSHSGRSSY
jgi:hypothetical protein